MTISIILVIIITAFVIGSFYIRSGNNSPPLLTGLGVFLVAFYLNLVFPATLSIFFKQGELTWARQYSDASTINTALTYLLLSLASFGISYYSIMGRRSDVYQPARNTENKIGAARSNEGFQGEGFIWLAITLGVLLKLVAILQIGIGPQLIERMAGSSRKLALIAGRESLSVTYLSMASTIADAAASLYLVQALKLRKNISLASAVLLACVLLTYMLIAKRSAVVLVLIPVALAYSSYIKPISIKSLPLAFSAVLLFGMASLLARIYGPNQAVGNTVDLRKISYANGSFVDFYLYSPEFSAFDMVARTVGQGRFITDSLGGPWSAFYKANLEPFLYVIPRAFWPDKPLYFVDISHGFSVAVSGGGVTARTSGLAATLVGYCVVLGGPILVVIGMSMMGALAALVDRMPNSKTAGGILVKATCLLLIFQLFRQGSIGWVFLTFLQNMVPVILTWVAYSYITGPKTAHAAPFMNRRAVR